MSYVKSHPFAAHLAAEEQVGAEALASSVDAALDVDDSNLHQD